jgi:hypothetical protein
MYVCHHPRNWWQSLGRAKEGVGRDGGTERSVRSSVEKVGTYFVEENAKGKDTKDGGDYHHTFSYMLCFDDYRHTFHICYVSFVCSTLLTHGQGLSHLIQVLEVLPYQNWFVSLVKVFFLECLD